MALSAPEALTADHDLSRFVCGKPALDHWLRARALANQEKGFTAVVVAHEAGRVVGYYGMAPTGVVPADQGRGLHAAFERVLEQPGADAAPMPAGVRRQLTEQQARHGVGRLPGADRAR